ncbi:MAG: RNase adapter RapZ [Ruminococcus sp.]|uniref:RNase adapter RapZ n=1 Tax=unclassified Ruminococcus TaxID=2608920 RepID=UPI00164B7A8C|nr:RNase adapter RapZ [uncultured Ruminococcus sp.]MBQ1585816.1 RNase adapter RapZ [Ruminococcus sp.]MBQ1921148.1 RNase adapter RapZ [Ruminococcus sp.]MBQ4171368.1 RNase adapter RapZ [Ruminococcus sp.]MBQ4250511.1 RNase adapter RapZ [Ruminococcus sp.]MBQ5630797.1 RNase adapter RapZ [Ruminococcus sp.]
MEFVIISGMSGAGKTSALHVLEDIGYYCVDNIPSSLLQTLYNLCRSSSDEGMKRVAVVVDVRGNENYKQMAAEIEEFKNENAGAKLLFLDAKSDVLILRYKETRRKHPLADKISEGSVSEAVEREVTLLSSVKKLADFMVDTTKMSNKQLRERVMSMFMEDTSQGITLTFMSFGFKYGIPLEADTIFDVRCLPNPFYIPELKPLTGMNKEVFDYVTESEDTLGFVNHSLGLLDYAVPLYLKEGKSELVVGIGCTGGKHRSVTVARIFETHFRELGYRCVIQHRDIDK